MAVGKSRPMTAAQLPPNCATAISALRELLTICFYPDLDISHKADVDILRGRRHMAEGSLQKLEIELGFRKPPIERKQKRPVPKKRKTKTR